MLCKDWRFYIGFDDFLVKFYVSKYPIPPVQVELRTVPTQFTTANINSSQIRLVFSIYGIFFHRTDKLLNFPHLDGLRHDVDVPVLIIYSKEKNTFEQEWVHPFLLLDKTFPAKDQILSPSATDPGVKKQFIYLLVDEMHVRF